MRRKPTESKKMSLIDYCPSRVRGRPMKFSVLTKRLYEAGERWGNQLGPEAERAAGSVLAHCLEGLATGAKDRTPPFAFLRKAKICARSLPAHIAVGAVIGVDSVFSRFPKRAATATAEGAPGDEAVARGNRAAENAGAALS